MEYVRTLLRVMPKSCKLLRYDYGSPGNCCTVTTVPQVTVGVVACSVSPHMTYVTVFHTWQRKTVFLKSAVSRKWLVLCLKKIVTFCA